MQAWEQQRLSLMIPDPWEVPKINKIGLIHMYVADALVEALNVSAEVDPESDSLINLNPVYTKIVEAADTFVDDPSEDTFALLVEACPGLKCKKINRFDPEEYVPDFRLLDDPVECLRSIREIILYKIYPSSRI